MEIKVEKLNSNDINKFIELINVFEDVFEMKDFQMPNKIYLQQLLKRDDFFAFVALLNNKVVGGLTSYIIQQYYSKSPLVYIFDLAVNTELQRQGIGKKLIERNNNYSKEIGAETVMVQADAIDDHAIKFYQNTGGKAEEVFHFDYQIKNSNG